MFEDIQKHRQAVRENIEKSLQIGFTESEDFEKAHQVGDIHPNGKWVWTQLPSGKFDWRVIKKTGAAAPSTAQKQTSEGKEVEVDKNSSEYKKAFSAAKRWASEIDERGREVELSAIKENLEAAKEIAENKDGKWSRNDVIRAKNSIVSETARKDAFEDVEKELKKKTEKKGKEGTKKITKPIVPNAVIQYGNLPSRQFDQLYKDFDSQFKSYTKEQLSQAIDKIGDSVSKQISLYKRMKANGDSKIALNKQGNFIDQLSARVYTLKRLLNEKEK